MVRACEIVIALIAAKVIGGKEQSATDQTAMHSIGALLVLIGVSLMAAAEYLQHRIDNYFRRGKSKDLETTTVSDAFLQ